MFESDQENLIVKLPYGFRDVFPTECRERKVIVDIIGQQFRQWGYGEVKTPAVEYTKNISTGAGDSWSHKLINFFDIDGSLVSLRADMTIPIARLVGMRIKRPQLPVRFCYFANSFRQSALQEGVKRVYSQAGLELIGTDSFTADVEILTILNKVLRVLGFKQYKIGLGQLQIIEGLCEWLGLGPKDSRFLKESLVKKNFVLISEFLEGVDKSKTDLFMSLIKPQQDLNFLKKVLARINISRADKGLAYLERVYRVLEELGFGPNLLIDLSILREFDYYSGLLFEVYSALTTDLIGNGGRYDGLIRKFGMGVAATGFALDLDMLHKSMDSSILAPFMKDFKLLLGGSRSDYAAFVKLSEKVREKGINVELYEGKIEDIGPQAQLREAGLAAVMSGDLSRVTVIQAQDGNRTEMTTQDFLKYLDGTNKT
ncbi:MAG: ATP phosphoribosyltransferase regulatory subunit [Actinomycetota bacterium]|jgi:ATP phosphoribosyltransferase regulatory subunit|nr:ATP phosphoribosyltransferase regulatory subunit [Actinomycetota bacterium]